MLSTYPYSVFEWVILAEEYPTQRRASQDYMLERFHDAMTILSIGQNVRR